MNRRVSLGVMIGMMLLVAAVTFSITSDIVTNRYNDRIIDLRAREEAQAKYAEIEREVRANYIGVIDDTLLNDSVARGYLAGIGDPYARYYDARAYERAQPTSGNVPAGIGALLHAGPDGYLVVDEVYPDSPALDAGMKAGDLIVRIGDTDLTPDNAVAMLAGMEGEAETRVTLTIRSDNVDRAEEFERRVVPVPSIYARLLEGTRVGYIIITEFNATTDDQFKREMERIIGLGASSLIFDLRDNPGGRLRYATRMLDRLLPAGVIVTALDKNNAVYTQEVSTAGSIELPMVAIVNAGTASSAEVFVQALRDYGLVSVVGVTTAGKGTMQQLIPLSDGSAIEVTVARLYTMSGDSFDGTGIHPDYEVLFEEPWKDLNETVDPQLKKALEVANAG